MRGVTIYMVSLTEIMKRNFISCLNMMEKIIDNCPADLWVKIYAGFPFWQQVYHALESVDYWFRESYRYVYDDETPKVWKPNKNVTSELDKSKKVFSDILSKEEIQQYLSCIYGKTDLFFSNLNDHKLKQPIAENNYEFTCLDVIDMQIRHVMYHVGHCICILRSHTDIEIEWVSHNER